MLLRSPKSTDKSTRIDVLFTDVRVIELRAILSTLLIEEVDATDVAERPTKPSQTMETGHRVFVLKCESWSGCIIAGAVHWHEDEGEYGQPSALVV